MHSLRRILYCHSNGAAVAAAITSAVTVGLITRADFFNSRHDQSDHVGLKKITACDDDAESVSQTEKQDVERRINDTPLPSFDTAVHTPSLLVRLLAPIGILSLPLPRILTKNDPAMKVDSRFLRNRKNDEEKLRRLLSEEAPKLRGDPDFEKKMTALREEIFHVVYGKGVTAQMRENFLIRYGCSGWTDQILRRLVELCVGGIVEIGAGHGQWQRALTDAYNTNESDSYISKENIERRKQFDFVLAYDDNSNLPLNKHIYNQYTQPHHDYFGNVHAVESIVDRDKILRSWHCRGRALLLVYPPPGPMAIETLEIYINAAPENDTLVYVGEGRGGANCDEAFFDFLESGEFVLIEIMEVMRPPGDKGCEKLYVLRKVKRDI